MGWVHCTVYVAREKSPIPLIEWDPPSAFIHVPCYKFAVTLNIGFCVHFYIYILIQNLSSSPTRVCATRAPHPPITLSVASIPLSFLILFILQSLMHLIVCWETRQTCLIASLTPIFLFCLIRLFFFVNYNIPSILII